jgi:hypothetical protein
MLSILNWQSYPPLLPSPEDYLKGKRQTIQTRLMSIQKTIKSIKRQLECAEGLERDLKRRFAKVDYQLAEIDGRLTICPSATEQKSNPKPRSRKNKVSSNQTVNLTPEQIAAVAAALGVEL